MIISVLSLMLVLGFVLDLVPICCVDAALKLMLILGLSHMLILIYYIDISVDSSIDVDVGVDL